MALSEMITQPRMKNGRTGWKEMAIYGLRKAFVDPAPRPRQTNSRMAGFFDMDSIAQGQWLPE